MANIILLSSLVTVVPGMAALWWFLRRYEGLFEEARIFFALIVGFFAGIAAAAFEFFTRFGDAQFAQQSGLFAAGMFFIAGYAFFENGMKTMFLGLRRFRGRRDTPYHGLTMGLGLGAMLAMMVLANAARAAETAGNPYGTLSFLLLGAIPAGGMLLHGATGTWVGQGVAENKLWKGWGIATLLQAPYMALLFFLWPLLGTALTPVNLLLPAAGSVGYGLFLLHAARKRILDRVVPPEIRDQIRRENRRAARAALGGGVATTGAGVAAASAALAADDSEE